MGLFYFAKYLAQLTAVLTFLVKKLLQIKILLAFKINYKRVIKKNNIYEN
jgi:hypothetical protein